MNKLKRWWRYRVALGQLNRAYEESMCRIRAKARTHGLVIKNGEAGCDYCGDDCGQCGNGGHIWRLEDEVRQVREAYSEGKKQLKRD